jgi:hypothetical protein
VWPAATTLVHQTAHRTCPWSLNAPRPAPSMQAQQAVYCCVHAGTPFTRPGHHDIDIVYMHDAPCVFTAAKRHKGALHCAALSHSVGPCKAAAAAVGTSDIAATSPQHRTFVHCPQNCCTVLASSTGTSAAWDGAATCNEGHSIGTIAVSGPKGSAKKLTNRP